MMPTKPLPSTAPTCQFCDAPAVPRLGKPDRCQHCAEIATEIANAGVDAAIAEIRRLKAERQEQQNEGAAA